MAKFAIPENLVALEEVVQTRTSGLQCTCSHRELSSSSIATYNLLPSTVGVPNKSSFAAQVLPTLDLAEVPEVLGLPIFSSHLKAPNGSASDLHQQNINDPGGTSSKNNGQHLYQSQCKMKNTYYQI